MLIVEDNDDAREALRSLLEVEGHEMFLADSGQKALEIVGTMPLDIAFIDIGLPDISGYDLAQRLQPRFGPVAECGCSP